jgi:uncharacterized membrane protein YraQ (UPF0718 family)
MKTNWRAEWKPLVMLLGVFLLCYHLPVGVPRFDNAVREGFELVRWYAREHVVFCLVPAFFIAGAIGVFVSQASVMRYLGPRANKALAYGVASVSGTVLAVCSCTVLPLFAGIWRMGAGLGPATAFLYAGPAINILAMVLTARVLGLRMGIARALGAVAFSLVIGGLMHLIFRREELNRAALAAQETPAEVRRPLWQNALFFGCLAAILVFANWARPEADSGLWGLVWRGKWLVTGLSAAGVAWMLVRWFGVALWKLAVAAAVVVLAALAFPGKPLVPFLAGVAGLSLVTSTHRGEAGEWFSSTWGFARQIAPLLLVGVLAAGFMLGRPGREGLIPSEWITQAVGGNSLRANLLAAVVGAFMYFATLTEVPIVQGLMGSGMGPGPALALLLAGPALSLQSMLVLRSIMGARKTAVYVTLTVIMATATGYLYGLVFARAGTNL